MQGLWLGLTLSLWGIALYTHGSMGPVLCLAFISSIIGGIIVAATETDF